MNKNTVLSLAPNVLKRMEYTLDVFYLLNFETDEIWTGNYSSYLIIDKLNGKNNNGICFFKNLECASRSIKFYR